MQFMTECSDMFSNRRILTNSAIADILDCHLLKFTFKNQRKISFASEEFFRNYVFDNGYHKSNDLELVR
jgi:hypothetical protein